LAHTVPYTKRKVLVERLDLKKGENRQKKRKIPRKEIKVPVTNECSVPIHEINHEIYKENII